MEDIQATTGSLNFNPPEIIIIKRKTWPVAKFYATADKMLIKSSKLVNFTAIEDKNKKAKQENQRVKAQKKSGSRKTFRVYQVTLTSTLQK